jgi:hypothetical protein
MLTIDNCPVCGRYEEGFWQNITHNLRDMAKEAGIYGIVWRTGKNGIKTAGQLIGPLRIAIALMKEEPRTIQEARRQKRVGDVSKLRSVAGALSESVRGHAGCTCKGVALTMISTHKHQLAKLRKMMKDRASQH